MLLSRSICLLIVPAVTLSLPAIAYADSNPAAQSAKVLTTDFRGRPPFTRAWQSAPVDLARLEESTGMLAAGSAHAPDRVRVVDFRGRPPFKRRSVPIEPGEIAELARFETVAEPPRPHRGPPGKATSRR
ncbi:MAG: hypothetical protein R3E84_10830 [Pseudomonadales bacterium]